MAQATAAEIGAAYFAAWSTKDVDKATDHVTDDVEIVAPNGTFHGHAGYHEFMDGFVKMVTSVTEFHHLRRRPDRPGLVRHPPANGARPDRR
jgi:ketosteroid isomerase-like protein